MTVTEVFLALLVGVVGLPILAVALAIAVMVRAHRAIVSLNQANVDLWDTYRDLMKEMVASVNKLRDNDQKHRSLIAALLTTLDRETLEKSPVLKRMLTEMDKAEMAAEAARTKAKDSLQTLKKEIPVTIQDVKEASPVSTLDTSPNTKQSSTTV